MKLVIIRYPETNKVAGLPGKPEAPSPRGRERISQLTEVCEQQKVQAVVYSVLPRTSLSGKALARVLHVPAIAMDSLRDRNFGDWSKWQWPQISLQLDKLSLESRYTFAPPHGESWQQMDVRLSEALRDIAALGYSSTAVVTHASCIRVLRALLGSESKESVTRLIPALGASYIEAYNPAAG